VALVSFQRGTPLDAIYVRKQAKDHGSARLMEGDVALPDGARVVVLEDVVTTGGSTLKAVEKLRERRLKVAGVIGLVDREEGGAEALRSAGLTFVPIFGRGEFPR
jgi:orotate phosphoribosyltransferase